MDPIFLAVFLSLVGCTVVVLAQTCWQAIRDDMRARERFLAYSSGA